MNVPIAFAVILVLVGADQLTKYLVLTHLADGSKMTVLPDLLQFRFAANTGAAFSLFNGKTWLLSVVTAAILFGAAFVLVRGLRNTGTENRIRSSRAEQWALILIIAGGLGNLIDRIFRGYVVDFIEVLFMKFAVFNFADCCVTIGAAVLIVSLLIDLFREGSHA